MFCLVHLLNDKQSVDQHLLININARGLLSFDGVGSNGISSGAYTLTSEAIWTDTRLPVTTAQPHPHKTYVAKATSQPVAIIPATGWVRNDQEEVMLISNVTNATAFPTPTTCPVR
jgi:hypothetical protein